ncbi:MAG TPA: DNRLRE domain-containing protein [Bacteroidales bacterium]|nr:DNRLRE domain-containing protein [Bacteroidales bacterium]
MRKKATVYCFSLFFSVFFSFAQTVVVPSSADALIEINNTGPCTTWQTTNYGSSTIMLASVWTWVALGCGQGTIRCVANFNLNIPAAAHRLYDNRATLNLYYPTGSTETDWYTGSATDNQFYIQRITAAWTELGVTWANQPATTTTGQITVPSSVPNPSTQDYHVDISNLVYDWMCNGIPNYGILMRQVGEGVTYRRVTFATKEFADPTKHPTISLEYAQIAATAPDTICQGDSYTLACALTNAANTSVYQFQWTHLNSGTNYSSQNVTDPAQVAGLNTYVVHVTNPWCESAWDTVQVFVTTLPATTASYTTPLCTGNDLHLNVSPAAQYQWSGPNGFTSSQQNPVITNVNNSHSGTYSVTVSNSSGCSASASANVTVNPQPTVTASASPAAVCPGQSTSLSASGASTYSWNTGATGSPITVNPTTATTYTVTGTTSAGCSSAATVSVTMNPMPVVTASATPAAICPGQNTSLSAGGATSYSWNTGATGSSVTVNPTTATTYTVTGTTAAGCSSTATVSVTMNPMPVVTALATPAAICTGQNTSLSAGGATSYSWNTGSTGTPITVSPTTSTTYTVTGTTVAGCSSTATVSVTVNPLPAVTASASPAAICTGQSTSLSAGGASSYLWNTGATGTPVTVSPTTSTTYSVTGTTTAGCSSSASVSVTVTPLPSVTASASPAAICPGQSTTLSASGASLYLWNTGATGASITVSPTSSTTYAVTGTTSSGCSSTVSVSVTVNPIPAITATAAPATVCSGQSASLSAGGASSYSWNTGATGSPITVSPATSTTYSVTGTTSAGCSSSASVSVTVNPLPAVSATASPAEICSGQNTTLTAAGASTYSWNTGATGVSISVSPAGSANYVVTGTSAAGCSASAYVNVVVHPLPVITVTASPATLCEGQSAALSAAGAASYVWNTGATGSSLSVNPVITTSYIVTGTSASGCTAEGNVNVPVFPVPDVVISGNTPVCQGSPLQLSATGGQSYLWNTLPPSTDSVVTVYPSTTTTYVVTANSNGCTGSASIEIHVYPSLNVSTSVTNAVCGFDNGTASVLIQDTGCTYEWNTVPPQYTQTATGLAAGTYTVTVEYNGCTGAANATVDNEPVPVATFYTRPEYKVIDEGEVLFYDLSTGDNVLWVWDFGDQASDTGRQVRHIYSDTGSYLVTLVVTDAYGCMDTVQKYIYIYQSFVFWIPNSFTPNGDEKNNIFLPVGEGCDTKNYYMAIYDRWGREIFYTEDINEGWNGTFNNHYDYTSTAPYTFVYMINVTDRSGRNHVFKGIVNLIR